jgi:EmrB/QacA subfamily drug resistance transporter
MTGTATEAGTVDGSLEGMTPRQQRLVLATVGLALMAVVSAVSGLNVALPSLARETGATQTQLTWIVDAYTVVFAGLLLFVGALGDRYGRKLLLTVGLVVFGGAAAMGMVVTDPDQLILVRMAMGVGAAAIMPTTLSVITTSFPERERPRAVGVWVGIAGGGAVIGLFVTALLLEWFPWSSFFGLNVVFALIALVGTRIFVPASVDQEPPSLDIVGALLSLVAIAAFVFGVIEGPVRGWDDPLTLAGLVIGVFGAIAFVLWELRVERPLLDPRLFRVRGFSAGTLTIGVQFLSAFGFFFVALQYLQFVTGRSPLEAAIALLPLPVILLPTARRAPHIAERVGFRRTGPVGLVSMAIGFAILSQLQVDSSYWLFFVGLVFFAFGMGFAGTPATTAITASLPMSKQGVASAVNDTARELGSAFGIAILGSLLNQGYRDGMLQAVAGLPSAAAERVLGSVAFTAAPELAAFGQRGRQLADAGRAAFVDGVGAAFLAAVLILVVGAVIVALVAPGVTEATKSDPEGAAAAATSDGASAALSATER